MWTYTDIYKAIIKYIDTDLQNTSYILNFGVDSLSLCKILSEECPNK